MSSLDDSISKVQKVFDAVAVLQLVERGLVDLDVDVGTYLSFELRHPGHPNEPVTIRMLLMSSTSWLKRGQRSA